MEKISPKFTLQTGSLERPNSQHNTIVIAMASIRDSHAKFRFLEGKSVNELFSLQTHVSEWKL